MGIYNTEQCRRWRMAMAPLMLSKGGGFKKGRGGNNNSRGRGGSRPAKSGAAPSTAEASTSPAALAQDSAGLCFYHWTYGEKASRCRKPCSWQGN